MRYTTIIDITEVKPVWRNWNASRLYLYMCLRCGYHEEDRDIITISLRDICWRLDMSFSAVRHSLKLLISSGLIQQTNTSTYKVNKWIEPKFPTNDKKERAIEREAETTGKSVFMIQWERTYKVAYSNKGTEEQRDWLNRAAPRYRQERQQWEQSQKK